MSKNTSKLNWFIAYRYFNSKHENGIISFITAISILGVLLGTAILIIVIAVLNGFKQHIDQKLLQMQPHVIIEVNNNNLDQEQISNLTSTINKTAEQINNKVINNYFIIKQNGLVKTNNNIIPVNIISYYNNNDNFLISEQLAVNTGLINYNLTNFEYPNEDYINTNIKNKNKNIIIAAPVLKHSILGPQPRFKRFTINGLITADDISTRITNDSNTNNIIMPYSKAISFFDLKPNYLSGVYIFLQNPIDAERFKDKLLENNYIKNLNNLSVLSWQDFNQSLFKAILLEKISIILLLVIIIAVAAFNLISGLYIQVSEKTKDIAILKTLGLNSKNTKNIFIIQGLLVGIIGAIFGVFFGTLISYNLDLILLGLQNIGLLNKNNIFLNAIIEHKIDINIDYYNSIIIIITALVICYLATLIPAKRANKIIPIDALVNK